MAMHSCAQHAHGQALHSHVLCCAPAWQRTHNCGCCTSKTAIWSRVGPATKRTSFEFNVVMAHFFKSDFFSSSGFPSRLTDRSLTLAIAS